MRILECENCGYARTSEEDGRQFHEVCNICYLDTCEMLTGKAEICDDCLREEKLK